MWAGKPRILKPLLTQANVSAEFPKIKKVYVLLADYNFEVSRLYIKNQVAALLCWYTGTLSTADYMSL